MADGACCRRLKAADAACRFQHVLGLPHRLQDNVESFRTPLSIVKKTNGRMSSCRASMKSSPGSPARAGRSPWRSRHFPRPAGDAHAKGAAAQRTDEPDGPLGEVQVVQGQADGDAHDQAAQDPVLDAPQREHLQRPGLQPLRRRRPRPCRRHGATGPARCGPPTLGALTAAAWPQPQPGRESARGAHDARGAGGRRATGGATPGGRGGRTAGGGMGMGMGMGMGGGGREGGRGGGARRARAEVEGDLGCPGRGRCGGRGGRDPRSPGLPPRRSLEPHSRGQGSARPPPSRPGGLGAHVAAGGRHPPGWHGWPAWPPSSSPGLLHQVRQRARRVWRSSRYLDRFVLWRALSGCCVATSLVACPGLSIARELIPLGGGLAATLQQSCLV